MSEEMLQETKVYGGRLKDRTLLLASSSGGAFTALSDVFLQCGDAVVCSVYNFHTHQQEFRIIECVEDRDSARGSKYVQSIPGNIFSESEEWLKKHEKNNLLFIGMGCQAAGFRSFADMKGFRDRVTIVDIICHGSPSPMIWREYIETIEKKGKIEKLTFKDKRNGWNNPAAYLNIEGREISLKEYARLFYSENMLRPCCHKCPYTTIERTTDLTIGDFWHIEEKLPAHYDRMGTSLFLIHTEKGMSLFEQAKEELDWFESNTAECWQYNLEKPTPVSKNRNDFWKTYQNGGINAVVQKYGHLSLASRIKKKLLRVISNK